MSTKTVCIQDARWLDAGEQPGAGLVSLVTPQVAEERWIVVSQWHSFSAGSRVWVLYQPPNSQNAGWEEFPEEMEQSVIIECTILGFAPFWFVDRSSWREPSIPIPPEQTPVRARSTIRPDNSFGPLPHFEAEKWPHFSPQFEVHGPALVRCERIIPLVEIPRYFAEESEAFTPSDFSLHGIRAYENWAESKHLLYGIKGTEGAADWWIRTKGTNSRVVLHAFELIGQGLAEICNRPFAGDT